MKYFFCKGSGNRKTGKIPVTMSSKRTCPNSCPFKKKGCYAKQFPTVLHWNKLTNGKLGNNWKTFIKKINDLPEKTFWRHNQAGDLAGINNKINKQKLIDLVSANKGKFGYTYTHKPLTKENRKLIRYANKNGFCINISCESVKQADLLLKQGFPTCLIVNSNLTQKVIKTPKGNKIVICPSQTMGLTCSNCKLCYKIDRNFIIGFKSHGTCKKYINKILNENIS